MCEVRCPKRLHRPEIHRRAVSGRHRGREGPGPPRQSRLHGAGELHPQPVNQKPGPACFGRLQGQNRRPRVSHGAKPQKPRVTLEIEASGLYRSPGRGEVSRQNHPHAGLKRDKPLLPVQRDPHPQGRPVRRDPRQHHLVERDPLLVRTAAVHRDDPPLNRAVVAKAQNGSGNLMRPQSGKPGAQKHEEARDQKRCPQPVADRGARSDRRDAGKSGPLRLVRL